jgi:hypothetical protein
MEKKLLTEQFSCRPFIRLFHKYIIILNCVVGIVPSPSHVVPQCEEITTIHFFIQIFNV